MVGAIDCAREGPDNKVVHRRAGRGVNKTLLPVYVLGDGAVDVKPLLM